MYFTLTFIFFWCLNKFLPWGHKDIFFYSSFTILTFYSWGFNLPGNKFCEWCALGVTFSFIRITHWSSSIIEKYFLFSWFTSVIERVCTYKWVCFWVSALFIILFVSPLSMPYCYNYCNFIINLDIWVFTCILNILGYLYFYINFSVIGWFAHAHT